MSSITNYNPNGSSDFSQSGCSGSCSAGNTRYASHPIPSVDVNRKPNGSSAINMYILKLAYSVN